jgi:hypothetical protein
VADLAELIAELCTYLAAAFFSDPESGTMEQIVQKSARAAD